jgi:hypothetical protein
MAQITAYVNETRQQGSRLRPYGEQIGQRVGMLLRHRAALAQVNSFGSSGRSEAIMLVIGATVMAARQSPRRLRLPKLVRSKVIATNDEGDEPIG